jgi:hypothetical protein
LSEAGLFAEVLDDWLWLDHCVRMAEATRSLAELCGDAEMMARYRELAAQWEHKAVEPRPLAEAAGAKSLQ